MSGTCLLTSSYFVLLLMKVYLSFAVKLSLVCATAASPLGFLILPIAAAHHISEVAATLVHLKN